MLQRITCQIYVLIFYFYHLYFSPEVGEVERDPAELLDWEWRRRRRRCTSRWQRYCYATISPRWRGRFESQKKINWKWIRFLTFSLLFPNKLLSCFSVMSEILDNFYASNQNIVDGSTRAGEKVRQLGSRFEQKDRMDLVTSWEEIPAYWSIRSIKWCVYHIFWRP